MSISVLFNPVERVNSVNKTKDLFNFLTVSPTSIADKADNAKKRTAAAEKSGFDGWKYSTTNNQGSVPISTPSIPSTNTADFIKGEEGFVDHRYKDAGGQSIGYGFYGNTYYSGDTITKEKADEVLNNIIAKQETKLLQFPIWSLLTENLKTALHSYMYNVGEGKFAKGSKMGDALASGDLNKIRSAISINTSLGRYNRRLEERRQKERQLFNS